MAEYLRVPSARHLVPIPDGLDVVQTAPLTDAGLTPYHAVRRSERKLGPTATAVVIGVGGLGHMAVQILRATSGARVIAVDTRDSARDLAARSGADLTLSPGPELVAEVRAFTGGVGADLVIDCVGSDDRDRLAGLKAPSAGADGVYPPGVLVPQRERGVPREDTGLEIVHQVQVRVARPSGTDLNDHLARTRLRYRDFVKNRIALPRIQSQRLHVTLQ
jgi:threonine dehydrogenase-like Zn-dependent dehydrogenase